MILYEGVPFAPGPNEDFPPKLDMTPLMGATDRGHTRVARLLKEADAVD